MEWYNSEKGRPIRIVLWSMALCSIFVGLLSLPSYFFLDNRYKARIEEAERQIQIQKADLVGNKTPEKFYLIDGLPAVVEVDGEPILDFLRKKEQK